MSLVEFIDLSIYLECVNQLSEKGKTQNDHHYERKKKTEDGIFFITWRNDFELCVKCLISI